MQLVYLLNVSIKLFYDLKKKRNGIIAVNG